jgi:hypothetical protein
VCAITFSGKALAAKGDRRGYQAISLVTDSGLDELVTSLAKLFLQDVNVSVKSYRVASPESMQWSLDKSMTEMAHIGLGVAKTMRVVLVGVMNSSVIDKFQEGFTDSEYLFESLSSVAEFEGEYLSLIGAPDSLPLVAVIVPPSVSASTQERLKGVISSNAPLNGVKFVVTVPRLALTGVMDSLKM